MSDVKLFRVSNDSAEDWTKRLRRKVGLRRLRESYLRELCLDFRPARLGFNLPLRKVWQIVYFVRCLRRTVD